MKTGNKKIFCSLAFSLLLVLSAVSPAYADGATNPLYPGRPNVVWNETSRSTVVVHIFNTTGYELDLTSSDFKDIDYPTDYHPQYGSTKASPFAFSPSGIPQVIPKQSAASFVVSWLDTALKNGFNNDNVLADLNIAYTMKQVVSSSAYNQSACPNPTTGDVTIHLDFNRVKEIQKSLKGEVFKLIVHSTEFLLDGAESVMEPNPIVLTGFLLSAYEIASDAKEIADRDGSSNQVYFSAYALPQNNSATSDFPGVYGGTNLNATSADAAAPYDGLYSQQGTTQGCPQAYIIPAVLVQRETGPSDGSLSGHMPVVFVTLSTVSDWEAALASQTQTTMQASPAGFKITQQLQREGRKGHAAFIKLTRTLNRNERELFDGAYKAIRDKKALTREQESLLLRFAEALEKHETTLPRLAAPMTQSIPANKNK